MIARWLLQHRFAALINNNNVVKQITDKVVGLNGDSDVYEILSRWPRASYPNLLKKLEIEECGDGNYNDIKPDINVDFNINGTIIYPDVETSPKKPNRKRKVPIIKENDSDIFKIK